MQLVLANIEKLSNEPNDRSVRQNLVPFECHSSAKQTLLKGINGTTSSAGMAGMAGMARMADLSGATALALALHCSGTALALDLTLVLASPEAPSGCDFPLHLHCQPSTTPLTARSTQTRGSINHLLVQLSGKTHCNGL